MFSKQKEEEVAEVIWATSSRRQFLLKLKAKYAGKINTVDEKNQSYLPFNYSIDGQKIAKKLSTQITKESQKIKKLLPEYNVCRSTTGESTITLEEVLHLAKLLQWLPSSLPSQSSQSRREIMDA